MIINSSSTINLEAVIERMAFKLAIISVVLAIACAGIAHGHYEEPHHEAHYHFKYAVDDHHTGDQKSHEESRDGYKVHGKYSVVDPDGHKRTVKYTSDKHTGFQAEVHREEVHHHIPAPVHKHEEKHVATHVSEITHHHGHEAHQEHSHHEESHHEEHHPAHYHFKYAVDDHHTGDQKSHEESRDGYKVEGKYTVVDPDGHKRTVKYTSDKHTGFQAEVHREEVHHHIPEHKHEAKHAESHGTWSSEITHHGHEAHHEQSHHEESHHEEPHHEEHHPAHYHFKYAVDDHHTGDKKSHEESRDGYKVEGKYTVVDPDGHKRTVKYTSDKHTGFQAEVHREEVHHHIPEPVHKHEDKHEDIHTAYISYSDPHAHYWANL